jgi:hypothetical protein
MANFLQKLLLWKEDTPDTIPTSPACYAFKAESFGIKAEQNSETNNELGNGRGASAKAFGTLNISGDLGMIWNTDNAPILMTHGIGAATSTAAATSDSWASTTAQIAGDLVNHSDGLHTLVCYTAGTTSSSEPDLAAYVTAGAGRGVRVTDGTVVWIIMPKLYEQSGVRGDCLTSFGVEEEDDNTCGGASDPQYCRYRGLYMNSLPINITGSMNAMKSTVGTVGMTEEDSIIVADEGGTYEEMSAKSGFTETELISDYFLLEDCTAYIDGSPISLKVTNFSGTITNNVTMEDALNSLKIDNIGLVEISGNVMLLLDNTIYAEAAGHDVKNFKFTFQKANGCLMELEFEQCKLEKSYKEFATDKTTMLNIPFSAFDTSTAYSVKWRTISPTSY